MATYKYAITKVKTADVLALTTSNAITKNLATQTGDTVASIVSVAIDKLDDVHHIVAVAYTV